MPELAIQAAQTPSRAGSGSVDAVRPSTENPASNPEGASDSQFAAVLKSRTDRKAETTESASNPASSAAAEPLDAAGKGAGVDLSVFFPLLGAGSPGASAPTATAEDESTAPTTTSVDQSFGAQDALTQIPGIVVPAPAPIMDSGAGRQNSGQKGEAAALAGSVVRTELPAPAPGNIATDAAISAGVPQMRSESRTRELPGKDFQAMMELPAAELRSLLDRTAAMAPAPTGVGTSNPSLRIETPLGHTQWHEDVGQKLTWMIGNNRQQADLVLTPPQLGRIEVSLTMNGDQASAIFTSPNPAVREALENSLQRLREVLADAGVSLGQTQVGSESPNQSAHREERNNGLNTTGSHYSAASSMPGPHAIAKTSVGQGMIDIFA